MEVALLGPLTVRAASDRPVEVTGTRLQRLLVALALGGGVPVHGAALVEAVWRDDADADHSSPNALQSLVSRLRRALGGAATVTAAGGGYRLGVDPADVDALAFEVDARAGRRALAAGDHDAALTALAAATARWRGDPDPDLVAPDVVQRLTARRLEVALDAVAAGLATGRLDDDAVAALEQWHGRHPWHEPLAAALVTVLAATGRPAEALAVYERVRADLADRLGADPSPALQQAHLAVLRGTVQSAMVQPATVQPATAPAPPSPHTSARSRLPVAITSFVGRDGDLDRLVDAVDTSRLVTVLGPGGAGKTRLAVEAARREEALGARPDGVVLVELASVTDPRELPGVLLAALGRRETGDSLRGARTLRSEDDLIEALVDTVADRAPLLVVDNLEHVIDDIARLLDVLLGRCPSLTVLTTSREPTGLAGEVVVALGPLALPDPDADDDEVRTSPAVSLFLDRARAVRPDLDATVSLTDVRTIVRRLDGLPLALELAAARLRTTPAAEIARRLDDRFRLLTTGSRAALPRHRTLRAVVAWSWDLLEPAERRVADRLAVFPGGIDPEAAAAVCAGGDVAPDDVPDLLASLADKSLLQPLHGASEPVRYRMLETLREYGVERLDAAGELGAARLAHASWFAELARRGDAGLRSRDQLAWVRRLQAENGNLVAALGELTARGDQRAIAMALDLAWWWMLLGRSAEAAAWFGEVSRLPATLDPPAHAIATAMHAVVTAVQGEPLPGAPAAGGAVAVGPAGDAPTLDTHAETRARLLAAAEALGVDDPRWQPIRHTLRPLLMYFGTGQSAPALADMTAALDHPDPWVRTAALGFRARWHENIGDLEAARADAEAAIAAWEALGDRYQTAALTTLIASLGLYRGDLVAAEQSLRDALHRLAELGERDLDDRFVVLLRLADVLERAGRPDEARATLLDLLATPGFAERELRSIALVGLAGLELRTAGRTTRAEELLDDAERLIADGAWTMFGADHGVAAVGAARAALALARGDTDQARSELTRAHVASLATRDLPAVAAVGVVVAALDLARGEPAVAAHRLGLAARLRGSDDPTEPTVATVTGAAVARLGREAFDAAWRAGRDTDGDTAAADLHPARRPGAPGAEPPSPESPVPTAGGTVGGSS